jgi:flagellar assembly factor FliW
MSEKEQEEMLAIQTSRFGELSVPKSSVIEFPSGLVGMGECKSFVLLEYKAPFSWLQSVENPSLAFVVIDGSEFISNFGMRIPKDSRECDFKDDDEIASLVIITVRPNPKETTANVKGPLFVNLRNRRGVQWIYDDSRLSARYPLWSEEKGAEDNASPAKSTTPGGNDSGQK